MTATVRGISVDGRSGQFNEDASREYTVVYKVFTDDRNDGPVEVRDAFGIPGLGSIYVAGNDSDPDAIVVNKSVSQADSPWEWLVEVTFSTVSVELNPAEQEDNPLNQPAEITYGFTNRRILIPGRYNTATSPTQTKDWEQGIVAPNGELFKPQPEMDISEPLMTIRRNVATINGADLMSLADTVNSVQFQGADERTLRLLAPEAQRKFHKAVGNYWAVSYQLAYRYTTWDVQVMNQGSFFLDSNGKQVTFTTTRDGIPYIGDLTSTGGENTTATPTFTRLRVYREVDFNGLGIL